MNRDFFKQEKVFKLSIRMEAKSRGLGAELVGIGICRQKDQAAVGPWRWTKLCQLQNPDNFIPPRSGCTCGDFFLTTGSEKGWLWGQVFHHLYQIKRQNQWAEGWKHGERPCGVSDARWHLPSRSLGHRASGAPSSDHWRPGESGTKQSEFFKPGSGDRLLISLPLFLSDRQVPASLLFLQVNWGFCTFCWEEKMSSSWRSGTSFCTPFATKSLRVSPFYLSFVKYQYSLLNLKNPWWTKRGKKKNNKEEGKKSLPLLAREKVF